MVTLKEIWSTDPLKWSTSAKKDDPNGDPFSTAGRWMQREWWRKGPALAVTVAGAAAYGSWAVNPRGVADWALGGEDSTELRELLRYVPAVPAEPILHDPRLAQIGGLALCAGALALNRYWPKLAEHSMGSWWAWWAERRLAERITVTFKQRWARAMVALGIIAPLVSFGIDDMGNVRAKAQLAFTDKPSSAGASRDILEKRARDLAGMLPIDGLGWAEGIEINDVTTDRTAFVEVILRYKQLPPPAMIPADLGPADRVVQDNGDVHDCIRLGLGHEGWVYWDLDEDAHCNVVGPSGFGKGVTMAAMINQWVQRNWLVLIIDGGGAPEHEVQWGPLIGSAVSYYRFTVTEEIKSLFAWEAQLNDVLAYGVMISALCVEQGVNKWADLSDELKERYPRIGVFADELSLALQKGDPKSMPDKIRKRIGNILATLRRGYRKYGVHVVMFDQVTHSGKTHLPQGALEQASMFMYVGPATRPQYRQMASSTMEWPSYKAGRGRGVAGKLGEPGTIKEVVRPLVTPDHLRPVVAAEAKRWAELRIPVPA